MTCLRRKRGRFDRVLDDRDDFTNGQPVKMKKLSRKRKSIQKKLMGSIESLNALEDLAASRASKFLYRISIDRFGLLNVVPNSNPLGIQRFVPSISISFKCECYIIMWVLYYHKKRERFELGQYEYTARVYFSFLVPLIHRLSHSSVRVDLVPWIC